MKISEIADAESALGLWKIITDNTWAAIDQQAQQQAKAAKAKAAKAKKAAKRKPKKSSAAAAKPVAAKSAPLKPVVLPKVDLPPARSAQDPKPQEPNTQARKQVAAVSTGPLPSKKNWDLWPKPASLAAQPSAAADASQAVRTRGEHDAEQDRAAPVIS